MIRIRIGRDLYSRHGEIIDWCMDNIGWSCWYESDLSETTPFYHTEMFGNMTLSFYNEFDAFKFKLRWGGDKIDN